jgi:hypothetical protein
MGARNRVGIGLSYRPAMPGYIGWRNWFLGIDSWAPYKFKNSSSELEFLKSIGARNRAGTGLSYRPARLHRLAEFIPWSKFLGSISV